MRILGLEIKRADKLAQQLHNPRQWHPLIVHEPFSGAWQRNQEMKMGDLCSSSAVYACVNRVANDIGKLRFKLVRKADGIWEEVERSPLAKVLRKPNAYQNQIQFREDWITSKLLYGNAYALKRRDNRGVVDGLWVLDPRRVEALVSESGDVFYRITLNQSENLLPSEYPEGQITVPQREVIHDRMNCLHHPLIGTSPLYAAMRAAAHGLSIQQNSAAFFENLSRPGGILKLPAGISNEDAEKFKLDWRTGFSGFHAGRVAVVGADVTYEPLYINASDSQLLEQLKWTAETVCSVFNVPAYMVGVGPLPTYNNIEALQQQYYSQCLQSLIEQMELCLDEGLELPEGTGTELDLEALMRMDTATRYKAHTDAVGGGWMTPNEARRKEDLPPVVGGDACFLQQQNYSLQALAKRDAKVDPFGKGGSDGNAV